MTTWLKRSAAALAILAPMFAPIGCFRMRSTEAGGDVDYEDVQGPRKIRISDVAVQHGYQLRVAATGLTFPTGITFDDRGQAYVVESGYSYGEVNQPARLVALDPAGNHRPIATSTNGPWNGVYWQGGSFFVAEGGAISGNGKILKISPEGAVTVLAQNLPSAGDHHTNGPVVDKDGTVYFGQGSATNSAYVGEDSFKFGWLKRNPQFHDVPCMDVKVGEPLESKNMVAPGEPKVMTSPYSPLGTAVPAGTVLPGRVPCSGAVMKVSSNGGNVELVAWGFRNPFGMAFDPMGRLYITDNSHDERGSRPIWGSPDLLWRVEPAGWYGWPDYSGNDPVSKKRYKRPGYPEPKPALLDHPRTPPEPQARFGSHSSSNGFDFSRNPEFGFVGEAFVAQFGDMAPDAGKVTTPVGYRVVRVDPTTGVVQDFATNKGAKNGPASLLELGGLERPVAARFDAAGTALYIVDFGVMATTDGHPQPIPRTGVVWKITRGAP